MDFDALLAQLRTEREMLEEAILVLERLARGSGKRRGRPPKWLSEPVVPLRLSPVKTKRIISAESRQRMAEAQRKRWAAKRGDDPKSSPG
jgi:hypothetical protein